MSQIVIQPASEIRTPERAEGNTQDYHCVDEVFASDPEGVYWQRAGWFDVNGVIERCGFFQIVVIGKPQASDDQYVKALAQQLGLPRLQKFEAGPMEPANEEAVEILKTKPMRFIRVRDAGTAGVTVAKH